MEFALVFVMFVMMITGLFELGRAIWVYNALMHGAKQGARYAMVHGSRNPISQDGMTVAEVTKKGVVGLTPDEVQTSISYSPDNQPGSQVTVDASYTFDFIFGPLLGLGDSVTISGSSTKTVVN